MPLYEWKCKSCGKVQEDLQLTGEPIAPQCCGAAMDRHYSPAFAVFKGDGWQTPKSKDTSSPSGLLG